MGSSVALFSFLMCHMGLCLCALLILLSLTVLVWRP